ncbi:Scr1 family TA system antitoxin-like transcriptional regulator [Streptomyces sp. MBT53]|uniref:Scr1 family TA system antitoxin-like transcriptional regulator n=1 Tax=Streptomyces sp. MBT53 TaxID=1488384 RepID=UPI001F23E237|nr:Scr1 family TA system antitoxin-like transcriptional regulator [Streptomyces sp. MBT53]
MTASARHGNRRSTSVARPSSASGLPTTWGVPWHGARRIQIYASTLVPGPLQVYGYREAVRSYPLARECGHDEAVLPSGLPVTFVLEESVLHHQVGGHDVMCAQISHLLGVVHPATNHSVSLIPLHAARTPEELPMEPFVIIDSRQVVLPVTPVPLVLEHREQTSRYTAAFARLHRLAITGCPASQHLAGLLSTLEPTPAGRTDIREGSDLPCAATA